MDRPHQADQSHFILVISAVLTTPLPRQVYAQSFLLYHAAKVTLVLLFLVGFHKLNLISAVFMARPPHSTSTQQNAPIQPPVSCCPSTQPCPILPRRLPRDILYLLFCERGDSAADLDSAGVPSHVKRLRHRCVAYQERATGLYRRHMVPGITHTPPQALGCSKTVKF